MAEEPKKNGKKKRAQDANDDDDLSAKRARKAAKKDAEIKRLQAELEADERAMKATTTTGGTGMPYVSDEDTN